MSHVGFLHHLLPEISLTNVSNMDVEPYQKDSQVVRAIMSELISVFKDIAQLQPIFREQSKFIPRIAARMLLISSHLIYNVQLDLERLR